MMHRGLSSLWIRIGGVLLLATLLVLGMIGSIRPVKAQQVQRAVFAPIHAKTNYMLRLSVVNAGNRPVGVRLHFLNAADFSPLASSDPSVLGPRTGLYYEIILTNAVFVAPAMEIQGQPDSDSLKVSVQLLDELGKTAALTNNEVIAGAIH